MNPREPPAGFLPTPAGRPKSGGGERIRTADPLRAKQALFHLSYTPDCRGGPSWNRTNDLTLIRRAL